MSAISSPSPKKRSSRLLDELRVNNELLRFRIDQIDRRIEQIDRQMVENRQEVREQFASIREEMRDMRQEMRDMRQDMTARLSWQTNFLGVMIVSMSIIITVAIVVLGWVLR